MSDKTATELLRERDYWEDAFCEQAGDTLSLDVENKELNERVEQLESLVLFMAPFFESACLQECGCPYSYFEHVEPHDCDNGCKAMKELDERMAALGLLEGDGE